MRGGHNPLEFYEQRIVSRGETHQRRAPSGPGRMLMPIPKNKSVQRVCYALFVHVFRAGRRPSGVAISRRLQKLCDV